MDEGLIRSVSLYFFLNFFDTRQAFWASQRALAIWRSHGSSQRTDLISIAKKILRNPRPFGFFSTPKAIGEFTLPTDLNLQPWMDFKKKAESAEYECVLLSQVMGFADNEVAAALCITEGTVRHRLNRGLRELGRGL